MTNETILPASDCADMSAVRQQIDRIDRALVHLLAERLTYIERAGIIKQKRDNVRDEWRIQDVLSKVLAESRRAGLPVSIAEPVWRTLIEKCIAHEFDVFDARKESQPAR
jgi:isochorismate pyruvate lyase